MSSESMVLISQVIQNDRSVRSTHLPKIPGFFKNNAVDVIRDAFLDCQPEKMVIPILLILLSPILVFTATFFATILDLTHTKSTSFPPYDTCVPTFYVPKHQYSKRYHILLLNALGVLFGAIHCSGWNLSFHTCTEQKLWRVASLVLTVIPIATLPLGFMIRDFFQKSFGFNLCAIVLILCTFAYVSARFVLLGLALVLLWRLPDDAFKAVNWTKFYPHFF
jgi:hypothetical protein